MLTLTSAPRLDETEVRSVILGTFRIPAAEVVTFPAGLLGFPDCHRFALIAGGSNGLFWLQSLDHAALTFLTIDPFSIAPDYSAEIPDLEAAAVGARDASEVALLAIVTLPGSADEGPTANLQGPIAVNLGTRLAKQVITGDTVHGVRWAFRLTEAA